VVVHNDAGHAMRGDRERCLGTGMNDYVSKPVSLQALVEVLNAWLPKETREKRSDVSAGETSVSESVPEVRIFVRANLLARMMDDEVLTDRILARFLESTPEQIKSLRQSLDSGNAAANVGGKRLRHVAFEFEKAALAGDLNAAASRLDELQLKFEALEDEMREKVQDCSQDAYHGRDAWRVPAPADRVRFSAAVGSNRRTKLET
jgi:HPt (histidine-containing phosphotransfer) domain-containing protein